MKLFLTFVLIGVFLAFPSSTRAKETPLRLAVSANFAPVLDKIAGDFSAHTGIKTSVTVASSGTLFAQIRNGAPFDIFLSADARRPQQLVSENLADSDSLIAYATGKLAYVSDNPAISDVDTLIASLNHNPGRLAIAHPELAPYGRAALQFLQKSGLEDEFVGRLVRGKNVLQAWQYFETGNVSQALVAASLVANKQEGKVVIPSYLHDEITQKLVIPGSSERHHDAMRFICYLVSESVQRSLKSAGYEPVQTPGACR